MYGSERRDIIEDIIKQKDDEKSDEPVFFTKRIGSTNYKVNVHFSNMSKETISDKIMRLIEIDTVNV